MDDRLQRRLMDADPLAAPGAFQADPARLDAIREQIMQSDQHSMRAAVRPRAIAGMALAATALAVVLAVASLARPTATTLAWERVPTPVSAAQMDAAEQACNEGLPTSPGSAASKGGTGTVVGGSGEGPALPTTLPPLVSLELHGSGGIAILADGDTTAYCLLVEQGDGFRMGGLLIPSANGATVGVVGIGKPGEGPSGGQATGSQSAGAVAGTPDGLQVMSMGMTFEGTSLGLIAGVAPAGVISVEVSGGPADGATATVTKGRFALWAPAALGASPTTVTARDALGHEVAHQTLLGAPPPGGGWIDKGTNQP